MKIFLLLKFLRIGVVVAFVIAGCAEGNDNAMIRSTDPSFKNESQILFAKSPNYNWKNKKVEVSFEDSFQKYVAVDAVSKTGKSTGLLLSKNNLQQGITIKLKVTDTVVRTKKTNEVMIESYDLHKGTNQFTIGYNDNKPHIIY